MELVHTTSSHLLPRQGDSPSLHSSTSTSSYIPAISYEDFTDSYLQNSIQRTTNDTFQARRERRTRVNPYPTPDVPTSSMALFQHPSLYAPRPSQSFNTDQSSNYSSGVSSTQLFVPDPLSAMISPEVDLPFRPVKALALEALMHYDLAQGFCVAARKIPIWGLPAVTLGRRGPLERHGRTDRSL